MNTVKKRLQATFLTLCICAGFALPALAAQDAQKPVAPAWIKAEEYVVFEDDPSFYESDSWREVVAIREIVDTDTEQAYKRAIELYVKQRDTEMSLRPPALSFELALIFDRVAYHGVGENSMLYANTSSGFSIIYTENKGQKPDYAQCLWNVRTTICYYQKNIETPHPPYEVFDGIGDFVNRWTFKTWNYMVDDERYSFDKFTNYWGFDHLKTLPLWADFKDYIYVQFDKRALSADSAPEELNGRVMLPIRALAEAAGATVSWDGATGTVTLKQRARTVSVIIGSETAYIDSTAYTLDAPAYAKDGRTMLPIRFISEALGLSVEWRAGRVVNIISPGMAFMDKTTIDEIAIGMGSILEYEGSNYLSTFAFTKAGSTSAKESLRNGWGISSREGLISTVVDFTENGGHNEMYRGEVEEMKAMSAAEQKAVKENYADGYMVNQILNWDKKWGDTGVVAWDLCRMSTLVQRGYRSGYITLEEALALVYPSVEKFRTTFHSWDEGIDNYLDGYAWWSRSDISEKRPRESNYTAIKAKWPEVYNDDWFTQECPAPTGVTYEELKSEVYQ